MTPTAGKWVSMNPASSASSPACASQPSTHPSAEPASASQANSTAKTRMTSVCVAPRQRMTAVASRWRST